MEFGVNLKLSNGSDLQCSSVAPTVICMPPTTGSINVDLPVWALSFMLLLAVACGAAFRPKLVS